MAEAARELVNSLKAKPEEYANNAFLRARGLFNDLKAKVTGDDSITFEDAAGVLSRELGFPRERALLYVQRYDKNNDGKLSRTELSSLKKGLEETRAQLLPKFREYDVDNNGFISLEEAGSILDKPPFNFPSDKIQLLLKSFDKDGNGQLDIEEFAGFYSEAKAMKNDINDCFDRLDQDGNGMLSPDELATVMRDRLGMEPSAAMQLVEMFDQNKDGALDKAEFIQLWTSMFGE